MKYRREYHRSLSKHKMKDSRYKVRGKTHKNGTVATSRQTWFVVANSNTDGTIARQSHNSQVPQLGGTSASAVVSAEAEKVVRPWAA